MINNPISLYSQPKDYLTPNTAINKNLAVSSKSTYSDILDCEEEINMLQISNLPEEKLLSSNKNPSNWKVKDSEYFFALNSKELEYMANPYYLQTMQPNISIKMREILYDWMMEVCAELSLKRETFHLSINYVDRYLSRCARVQKSEYQLIGLTSMYISAKIEEILSPSLVDWASSADNGYSIEKIIETETKILKNLDFKVFPSTSYAWINWLMTQWDSFIDFHFSLVPGNNPKSFDQFLNKKKAKLECEERMIYFKQPNQKAYKRYRETLQILDLSLLNFEILKFFPKHATSGLLYLMISKYFYETNYSLLYFNGNYKDNSFIEYQVGLDSDSLDSFQLESTGIVQNLFSEFLSAAVEIENIEDIYLSVAFFHPFLSIEAGFDLPNACKTQSKSKIESHYEEFLAYQTHNPKNLEILLGLSL